MKTTSVGNLLIDEAIPEDLREEGRVFDKKTIHTFFNALAERHPDQYRETLKNLSDIARDASWTEGASVSLKALTRSKAKERVLAPVREKLHQILNDPNQTEESLDKAIPELLLPHSKPLTDALLEEAKQEKSPYYLQIASGGRGKASDLNSLRGADLLATDSKGQLIPVPVLHSYAEGFDPVERFVGSFSQRKNMAETKIATADAGYLTKRISHAAHRQVVTREAPDATRLPVGLPVSATDKDNIGAVLAMDAGPLKAGTTLTGRDLETLKEQGIEKVLLHSPMTEQTPDGGLSRLAAGRRDRHGLSRIGDNVGVASAQVVGEKLAQGSLNSKHQTLLGNKRQNRSGQVYLERLLNGPENFPEAGPLAEHDGVVKEIRDAPQGGKYVVVGDHEHYLYPGLEPVVKVGDSVESGDDLSDGVPHPKDLVRLRGIGQARRDYLGMLGEALSGSGVDAKRRTLESVVTGLINWAKVTDPDGIGDHVPDDIVQANTLLHGYKPRPGAELLTPSRSIGKYLEEPVLHYTPGTKITKKVAKELDEWKVKDVNVHHDPPPFEPHMERSVMSVYHDPDWMVRLQGFYTTNAFMDALHRGGTSDRNSTSFVPALAHGAGFGTDLTTKGTYGAPAVTATPSIPIATAPLDLKI